MKRSGKKVRSQPRVGKQFQVFVPDFPTSTAASASKGEETATTGSEKVPAKGPTTAPIWTPSRLGAEEVEKYLDFVRGLFHDRKEQLCEERALHILAKCDFNVEEVQELLAPCEPPEEDQGIDPQQGAAGDDAWEGDDFCMICTGGGILIMCDFESCNKVYHPACIGLETVPSGTWMCPRHSCHKSGCEGKTLEYQCFQCPTSYCRSHVPPNLRRLQDRSIDFLCFDCLEKEKKQLTRGGGSTKTTTTANALVNETNGKKGSSRARGSSAISKHAGPKITTAYVMQTAFLKRIANLIKRQGKEVVRQPMVGNKPIDLYKLYKEVVKQGGINNVVEDSRWRRIISNLGIPSTINMSEILLYHYMHCLYTYERLHFSGFVPLQNKSLLQKATALMAPSPARPAKTAANAAVGGGSSAQTGNGGNATSGNRKRGRSSGSAPNKTKSHRTENSGKRR